jgi:two-component system, sensor histidine kinase and response regulator
MELLNSVMESILIVDNDNRIVFHNPALSDLFEVEREEDLTGKSFLEFVSREQWHLVGDQTDLRRAGSSSRYELEIVTAKGNRKTAALSVCPRTDATGKTTGAIATVVDISTRKAMERELEEGNRLSEALALEAHQASRAKSEFLANMSHEIRTPMNGIIGMTGLLLETELDGEQRDYATTIQRSADALLAIINDILDFSKIEAGKLELEQIDFDLRTMLGDILDLIAVSAEEKGLDLNLRIDPDVPSLLRGDPGRLRQVLMNLLGNAVKFTSTGEVLLGIEIAEALSETEVLLRFAVSDTGIGIEPDKLEILFAPFTQADTSTTRKFGGTGLGLAISRKLSSLMGGTIMAESHAGAGSVFSFTAKVGLRKPHPSGSEMIPEDHDLLDGTKVLVVDDNLTNRTILAGMLARWGCMHDEAASAEEALTLLRDAHRGGTGYDVAILDMHMPGGMNGEELGIAIRGDDVLSGTVLLIMYTSLASRGDAAALGQIGFSAYLTKPVKIREFRDCLLSVLKRGGIRVDRQPLITRHSLAESRKEDVRILLAEDNPVNRMLAMKILEKLGYTAKAVENGEEVLEELSTTPYDLVLMDVQMPVLDGFDTTRAIRSGSSRALDRNVPIVAMTALAMSGDRERCLEAGMNGYVSKPYNPVELAEAIESLTRTGVRGHDHQISDSGSFRGGVRENG